jgi:type II secretory pathway pseudopilin PulG
MRKTNGFTLTEILIVIGLIVLILLLAMPALNLMTGSRSIEGAQNQLSSFIGRSRQMALGLQEPRGVMFYRLPDGAMQGVFVQEWRGRDTGRTAEVYLDLVENTDPMGFPVGVAMQIIDDAAMSGSVRSDDGYVGFNDLGGGVQVGGVIMFDALGKTMHVSYGFTTQHWIRDPATLVYSKIPSPMSALLKINDSAGDLDYFDPPNFAGATYSSIGFILIESDTLQSQFGDYYPDPQVAGGGYSTSEQNEEAYIDANAIPFLVNRYNGTLIKGE